MEETQLQSSNKQSSSQRPLTAFPSLSSKQSHSIEKTLSSRSSGGSKSEENCESCSKTKVCIQQKCIESQEMNFCCDKCYKKKHSDHFKDLVIDISSIDSQIRKLHQEVIDGPLFRLATDLREMIKDFNDIKKLFPQIQEIPIIEFALHSIKINQINGKSKEDYDKMRKESIKNAISLTKIEKKNQKLRLHIDDTELENNTMSLLKKYEEIIQLQQEKLVEYKERTSKIFQEISKNKPPQVNVVQYPSLTIGSKPIKFTEKQNNNNFSNNNNSTQDRDEELLSYNNSNLNSYNSNNNNSYNNQSYNLNSSFQQNCGQIINSNSNLFMISQTQQQNSIFSNGQAAVKKGVDYSDSNPTFLYQNQCLSNSISNQRYDSNSNSKKYANDLFNYQPLLQKQLQEQYEQYTQQKLEAASQTMSNSNNKPLSRSINNLFSENNQNNNNSVSYSNSNIDQLRSTPYKQQKTQKKINEYFTSNRNPKPTIKQEEQNLLKQTLFQDEKFIHYQQQQLLFYQQQKEIQQNQVFQQDQQKLQVSKQQKTLALTTKQNSIQQEYQNQLNLPNKQIQQQQQQQLQTLQQLQKNQIQLQQQQQPQSIAKEIIFQKTDSLVQKQQSNQEQQPYKKIDNVFMKNDGPLIDELMKLTQSTVYTQYDDENDLRKSPSLQVYNSQLSSYPNNKLLTESYLKEKQMANQINIEESQEFNANQFKQPIIIHSLEMNCSEQLSDINEHSNSIEVNLSVQSKAKQSETDFNNKNKNKRSKVISIPSTSSLSSVSKQEVNEAKVFYQQTFGAQPDQSKEYQQQIEPSQDMQCWETLTDTQNHDKNS